MHLTFYRLQLFTSAAPMPWTRPLSWFLFRHHKGLGTELFIGPLHVAMSVR